MPYSHPQPLDKKLAHRSIKHLLPGAMALAGAAGFVNSVVLGFFRTPVSHMSGAVSHLGGNVAEHRLSDIWASVTIILGFLTGAALAGVMVGAWKLVPSRRYGIALIVEGFLIALGAYLLLHGRRIGLPALSMACGLQNALTSSYCGLMIRTTHVTGIVTDIGVMLGHWMRHGQIEYWKLRFLSFVFCAFGCGGFLGALTDVTFGPECLLVIGLIYAIAGAVFAVLVHRGVVTITPPSMPGAPRSAAFPT
ncbi:MAG: hypothetical protein JWM99_4834 [Verrucomicrobiales bacterium]|nr:hypothetical protein [Verrucomicrobiales bacterium]